MARPEGLEPSTYRLTAGRSTIELRANKFLLHIYYSKSQFVCKYFFLTNQFFGFAFAYSIIYNRLHRRVLWQIIKIITKF